MWLVLTFSLRIKFLFLLWIIIRSAFDAAVSATAAWCILYSFTKVLWPQCFWAFLAIHFIWDLSLVKYLRTHTRQDCFLYLRLESISVARLEANRAPSKQVEKDRTGSVGWYTKALGA